MWDWIKQEYGIRKFPIITGALIITYVIWCMVIYSLNIIPENLYEEIVEVGQETDLFWWILLFYAAMLEEILFRAPLTFVVKGLKHPLLIASSVIGLSVLFGYIHQMTWWHVLVQGVFGLMISVMYLKFGGAQGKFVKPLICTSIAHFATNATLILLQNYVNAL